MYEVYTEESETVTSEVKSQILEHYKIKINLK